MAILLGFNASLINVERFGHNIHLFPDNLVHMLHGRFGFRTRLVFDAVFNCRSFSQLETFVGVVELTLLVVLFTVKIRRAFLAVLARCGFG